MRFEIERRSDSDPDSWEATGTADGQGASAATDAVASIAETTGIYRVRPSPDEIWLLCRVNVDGSAERIDAVYRPDWPKRGAGGQPSRPNRRRHQKELCREHAADQVFGSPGRLAG